MKRLVKQPKIESHLHRIIGQLRGLERMITEKRDCEDIITQLMACRASLEKLGILILSDESSYCFIGKDNPEKKLQHLEKITNKLFKLT